MSEYATDYLKTFKGADCFEKWIERVRWRIIAEAAARYGAKKILEAGCGPDPLFGLIKDWDEYVIVEPREEFAQMATALAIELSAMPIIVCQERLEEYHAQTNRFDFVILSSLLHEVPNPVEVLWAAKRVCKPGGIIHINVPNVYSLHNQLGVEMGLVSDVFEHSEMDKKFWRHSRFDIGSLHDLVAESDLHILRSGTYLLKPFSDNQMAKIATAEVIEGLCKLVERPRFKGLGCEIFVEAQPKD